MKNKQQFEMFITRALGEDPPRVDVADSVLETLAARHGRSVFVSDRPLIWLAALSSAVAIPAVVLATVIYNAAASPLTELVESISWVIQ